jgi:hypothetical protein
MRNAASQATLSLAAGALRPIPPREEIDERIIPPFPHRRAHAVKIRLWERILNFLGLPLHQTAK